MIVRVSARGQANGSADGYLCAREQLGQAERRVRTVGTATFLRVPSVIWFNFGNIDEICTRFSSDEHGELHAVRGVWWGSKPRAGAFTVAEVHGCHGAKTMFVSFCTLPVAGRSRWGNVGVRT